MALTPVVGVTGEYVVYRYWFDQAAAVPTGVPSLLTRQGLRFGLDLWLPLIR